MKPVTIAYQAAVDGKIRRVNVTLAPASDVGLPLAGDQRVFLAMLNLAMRQEPFRDTVEFRLTNLLDLLGRNQGGANYQRLRESLDRLASLTIRINAELVSRSGQAYARTDDATHVIDSYHLTTESGKLCSVTWGRMVRDAIVLGDLKGLNWDLVQSLENLTATTLYRVLDRVKLAGEPTWEIGWKALGQALGLSTNYARPGRFKQTVEPAINELVARGVIEGWEYQRGGKFIFLLRNYVRTELRRVLIELGVYPPVAHQLVIAHEPFEIMAQCDCVQHGARRPNAPAGYLVEAIRGAYEPRYLDDDIERFEALWDMLCAEERDLYHQAAVQICGIGDDLFATRPDPGAWPMTLRAVARHLVCHGYDPEEVLGGPAPSASFRVVETAD